MPKSPAALIQINTSVTRGIDAQTFMLLSLVQELQAALQSMMNIAQITHLQGCRSVHLAFLHNTKHVSKTRTYETYKEPKRLNPYFLPGSRGRHDHKHIAKGYTKCHCGVGFNEYHQQKNTTIMLVALLSSMLIVVSSFLIVIQRKRRVFS